MSSKSHPKHPLPTDTSTSARHDFDSHRFTTESTMMHTHAQTLLSTGTIDAAMATELSQPWHRTGEVRVQYSKEYLQLHPAYTGSNAHEMPTLNWAMRKQRERDRKAEEWLEAYFGAGGGYEEEKKGKEEHAVVGASGGGEEEEEEEEQDRQTANTPSSSPPIRRTHNRHISLSDPSTPTSPLPQDPSLTSAPRRISHSSAPDVSHPARKLRQNSKSGAHASHLTPKRKSKSKSRSTDKFPSPVPLTPLPEYPSYAAHDYFALAALCRARKLPGAGRVGVLRNRLVQDDMNVAAGVARETKRGTGGRRRYVHGVPEEQSSRGAEGSSGEQEEKKKKKKDKADVGEKDGGEEVRGETGGKRKRGGDGGSGGDGEAKKVKVTE